MTSTTHASQLYFAGSACPGNPRYRPAAFFQAREAQKPPSITVASEDLQKSLARRKNNTFGLAQMALDPRRRSAR
eukprot:1446976-Pyramimonas_sp.AAC.1